MSERKRPFSPITASDQKNNPQNIKFIPPVIFFVFLVLDEIFLFRSDTIYINNSIGRLFFLLLLHSLHAVTTLLFVVFPPLEIGII